MDLSENIKLLRKKAGLSQVTVAERLGMTSQNYSLLENGKTELTYSKMQKLAEIFGVSVGELLGLEGAQSVPNGEQASEIEVLKKENERLQREVGLLGLQGKFIQMLEKHISDATHYANKVIATEMWHFEDNRVKHLFLEGQCFIKIFEEFLRSNNDIANLFMSLDFNGEKGNDKNIYQDMHEFIVEAYESKLLLFSDENRLVSLIEKHTTELQKHIERSQNDKKYTSGWFTHEEITENFNAKISLLKKCLQKMRQQYKLNL